MKLKEKLADEYTPNAACVEELHLGCVSRDAYIAGFEKCREMAAQEIKGFTVATKYGLFKKLQNLGEEEV